MRRRVLLAAVAAVTALPRRAAAGTVNEEGGLGLGGHDPVAYFVVTRALPGREDITATHDGVTYRFATAANREAFLADPVRYLPQFGGFCAYAVARGYKAVVDPTAFAIVGGRLFLNYNAAIAALWQRDRAREIRRGDANWPQVMHSAEVAR